MGYTFGEVGGKLEQEAGILNTPWNFLCSS